MEAVVTSLFASANARSGFGVMVRICGDDYMLSFGHARSNELEQLRRLKVNDKIILRSHNVSHAPKYAYPIILGDYLERDSTIKYERPPNKGGC